MSAEALPLISVILPTRDRPRLLPIALACYRSQSYPNRELLVVDDGDRFPADEAAIVAAGGRLIRVTPGLPLGAKLNRGIEAARGSLCAKMDDDDYYAPGYLQSMATAIGRDRGIVCRPRLIFLLGFLFFDLQRWEIRRSHDRNVPGASLFFDRSAWELRPFRALPGDEDSWFIMDHSRLGTELDVVDDLGLFVAVRHQGSLGDRGHTWTHQGDGRLLEDQLRELNLDTRRPEAVFPEPALRVYRALHAELRRDGTASGAAPSGPVGTYARRALARLLTGRE